MDTSNPPSVRTAASRYAALETIRSPYLRRARECAKVTIPSLLPPEGYSGTTSLPTPYQSMGADGALALAGKVLFALFPPNQSYFRQTISEKVIAELKGVAQADNLRSQIEQALQQTEARCTSDLSERGARAQLGEAVLHLIVTGNGLLRVPKEGPLSFFRLDSFVLRRAHDGTVLEIVVCEKAHLNDLSDDIKAQLLAETGRPSAPPSDPHAGAVDIYTHVELVGESYKEYQEINGVRIAGTDGSSPKDKPAWIAPPWNFVPGEHYGRGRTYEYLGDLLSLEGLSRALVEGTAAAARVLIMVRANGTTDENDVMEADNLDVIVGDRDDVGVLQLDKYADFRVAADMIDRLERRVARAFLMTSSIQRNAERVTAEEIRLMAQELEQNLGSVYANLANSLQLPLAQRQLHVLTLRGELPALPKGAVKPSITTGLEALGRGQDIQKLRALVSGVAEAFGPQVAAQNLNVSDYIRRFGTGIGINTEGLVKTEEQIAQEQQQAMQMQMMQQLGPNAINQIGGLAKSAQEQQ